MRTTNAPVEQIDFSAANTVGIPCAQILPFGFMRAVVNAWGQYEPYAEYWSEGGDRWVAKLIYSSSVIKFIHNPTPEMVR